MTEQRLKEIMSEFGLSDVLIKSFWDAKPLGSDITDLPEDAFREIMMRDLKKWKWADEISKELNEKGML